MNKREELLKNLIVSIESWSDNYSCDDLECPDYGCAYCPLEGLEHTVKELAKPSGCIDE